WSLRRVRIDQPHIPLQTYFTPCEARFVRTDLRRTGQQIGYLMGSGDQVPDALEQMGYKVHLLSDDDVERGDLHGSAPIAAGVPPSNPRPRLRALQPRLLDYVSNGGRLVIQYNRPDDGLGKLGPYPFTISNDRVTVEGVPVTLTRPEHSLLNVPNKIG